MSDVPAFAELALIKAHLAITQFFEMGDGPVTVVVAYLSRARIIPIGLFSRPLLGLGLAPGASNLLFR